MRIEVINTGTELMLGQVVNTHLGYFGERLLELGLRISRQVCVPDGDPIREVLVESVPRCEVILVTGGLGPTSDDLTREITAELFEMELQLDADAMAAIEARFAKMNKVPNENNRRQAMVPAGARILHNPWGTAPGLHFPRDESAGRPAIFLLPGPPRELQPMFDAEVLPVLKEMLAGSGAQVPEQRGYYFYGVGESDMAAKLDPLLGDVDGLELGYCIKNGGVIVRGIGGQEVLDSMDPVVRAAFPENLVSDDGSTMEEVVVRMLESRGESISMAESCTGGFIAHKVTMVSGSSGVFGRGFVTYANQAKTDLLGVPEAMLAEHGAVSEPVARAMAEGCLRASDADHAVAVTGIAGPTGGSNEKPVGTVFISQASKGEETMVVKRLIQTDRETFKVRVTQAALDLVRRRMLAPT
ncbi:MAG: nicotinamide-nucleotide amidase [Verrucomicrobiales bacterium]|jgi:nicotinamide-nucleotide amidase